MIRMLALGDPAPWFHAQALDGRANYAFDTAAGRWIVMLLLGSGAPEAAQAALRSLQAARGLFDDHRAAFFGVTIDPADAGCGRIAQQLPGIRWFLDYDRRISAAFGAVNGEPASESVAYTPHWLLLDPMLRVRAHAALSEGAAVFEALRQRLAQPAEISTAPVLIVPDVLPPDLCRRLIEAYQETGGSASGFMRDVNGVTVEVVDHHHKRRADHVIADEHLLTALKRRLSAALRPMIRRAFQADMNRIERFIVACYEEEGAGHFRAHRDNTTMGTAHRKFACTINLNADYEGGELCFPEFGGRTYRASVGGAVVFSCSLLHEARPVTRGRRYAFLPFLYDDDGARLRERNLSYVGPELQGYRSGLSAEPPAESA